MVQAIEAMNQAYEALSTGRALAPLRTHLEVAEFGGLNLYMPAYLNASSGQDSLAVKIVGVYPENAASGLPIIHASVLVSEARTGKPIALLEGGSLTALRTGAASGAATDLLARPDSHLVAIFGAGVQARTQLEAVCCVRAIDRAWIYDSSPSKTDQFIQDLAGKGPIPRDLRRAPDPAAAVRDADVICTATTSATPVFRDSDLKPGVHINGVGSFTPQMQEIPSSTVMRARVYVDSREAALSEAGDLIRPIETGLVNEIDIQGEIGEVLAGQASGRRTTEEITFFKSVGIAVQDAAAARLALENAMRLGLGQRVAW